MSNTDPHSFADDLPARGSQIKSTGSAGIAKPSLTSAQAATTAHLLSGYSWSYLGTGTTVTYAYRADGTPSPDDGVSGFARFNPQQIALAERAFTAWSDVANIRFQRTGGDYGNDASILLANFTDGDGGAGYTVSPGVRDARSDSGDVWIDGTLSYETAPFPGNYGAQTLAHEIGHALGLAHPSDYDDSDDTKPTYRDSASYYEDGGQYTIMSYFGEDVTGASFRNRYADVPLVDDIAAAQALYGANTATRTGDTVYGFHANAGRDWFDAAATTPIYAVWDAGGTDTFDFSGYADRNRVDLRAGAFSDVARLRGNVSIAPGVTIERAYAGAGGDSLTGNAAANLLVGGAGADRIFGEAGDDVIHGGGGDDFLDGGSGTDVIDGGPGYDVVALLGNYPDYNISADPGGWTTISGNGVTVHVRNVEGIYISPDTYIGGYSQTPGFDHSYFGHRAAAPANLDAFRAGISDFNGDGRSDILWRHAGGGLSTWHVSGGSLAQAQFNAAAGTGWQAVDTFDMNGDGRSDILWREPAGYMSVWLGGGTASFQPGSYTSGAGSDWRIAGVGDLDGDGRGDILWQHGSGSLSAWQSTGAGFNQNSWSHASPGGNWTVEGLGDVDGNGQADILWRNTQGSLSVWAAEGMGFRENLFNDTSLDRSWHLAGFADFTGDGLADLLWRGGDGATALWSSTGTGWAKGVYDDRSVGPDWQVAEVGDFNGDGRADLLWRHAGGGISTWQWNGHGFDQAVANDASVGNDWQIVAHGFPA